MSVLVVVEHDRGAMATASGEALNAGRQLAAATGGPLDALTIGADADPIADQLGRFGVATVHQAHHSLLTDYGPEAWGAVVAATAGELAPAAVLAAGTDRGHEVLAQAAARLDLPMVANCTTTVTPGEPTTVTRVRWGGSLLEEATLTAPVALITTALHGFDGEPAGEPGPAVTRELLPELDPVLARSVVRERVERTAGITLATAPGGRRRWPRCRLGRRVRPARGARRPARWRRRLLARRHQQRLAPAP